MREITLLNSKGGTGKTTMALSLAVRAALQGRRVAMIDTDRQQSLFQWGGLRRAEPAIPVESILLPNLARRLTSLRRDGDLDLVVIDTHGSLSELEPALAGATEIVVPVQPSGVDYMELRRVVALCGRYKAQTWIVLNRIKTKRDRIDLASHIEDLVTGVPRGRLARSMIVDRVAHRSHFLEGLTAEEVGDRQAQAEVHALGAELGLL